MHRPARRSRSLLLSLALALGLVLPTTPASAAVQPPDSWTSPDGTAGSTRTNLGETSIRLGTAARAARAWQVRGTSDGRLTIGGHAAPTTVGGVVYRVYRDLSWSGPARLVAFSAGTGAQLWSVALPTGTSTSGRDYSWGVTVTGTTALVPYGGYQQAPGLVAVDLTRRAVVWSKAQGGADEVTSLEAAPVVVDGDRALLLAQDRLTAYRVGDGTRLWSVPTPRWTEAVTAAGGTAYTTGAAGLVAWSTSTGTRLWSAASGQEQPMVAGGRVVAVQVNAVVAYRAAGCGAATCAPLWVARFDDYASIGGLTADTLFATSTTSDASGGFRGVVHRLSAASGRSQWSATTAPRTRLTAPVRIGDTVWLAQGDAAQDVLTAWSATAPSGQGVRPVRTIAEPAGTIQTVSGASGAVVTWAWTSVMTAYRVPTS